MADQLAYIKKYTNLSLGLLPNVDHIRWLITEVERLREHIADLEDTPASPAIRPR